jgi:hypothetical protein
MDTRLELTLTLHGMDSFNDDVDAVVFAQKLKVFLQGIRDADRAANGKPRHRLFLTELRKNTATASVREQVTVHGPPPASAMRFYSHAVDAIYNKRPEARHLPPRLIDNVVKLNRGAGHSFAFGELKSTAGQLVRLDSYLGNTASSLLTEIANENKVAPEPERGFTGFAYGSFDGVLKAVDLRGEVKQGKLILTAGGKEIECTLNNLSSDELRIALDTRVMAYGRAHYDGTSGLPVRLDIAKADPVGTSHVADLSRWGGAFAIPESVPEALVVNARIGIPVFSSLFSTAIVPPMATTLTISSSSSMNANAGTVRFTPRPSPLLK